METRKHAACRMRAKVAVARGTPKHLLRPETTLMCRRVHGSRFSERPGFPLPATNEIDIVLSLRNFATPFDGEPPRFVADARASFSPRVRALPDMDPAQTARLRFQGEGWRRHRFHGWHWAVPLQGGRARARRRRRSSRGEAVVGVANYRAESDISSASRRPAVPSGCPG